MATSGNREGAGGGVGGLDQRCYVVYGGRVEDAGGRGGGHELAEVSRCVDDGRRVDSDSIR